MRRRPATWVALERLGRERLSRHVTMRDLLYSEVAAMHGLANVPDDPELALAAGRRLAQELIEPLIETFGPVDLRSGYRSAALNDLGAGLTPQKMAATDRIVPGHVWDRRDAAGRMGACATVSIPWFAAQYRAGRDWRDLAWWLWDHLEFHEVYFFPVNAAFNLTWREAPERRVLSYIAPRGWLVGDGRAPDPGRAARHADFPPFRGIAYPQPPGPVA